MARYGKIDILVNNAGIARSETPAEQVADEHWLNVLDVNLNGTFWCCRCVRAPYAHCEIRRHRQRRLDVGLIVNKPQAQSYYNRLEGGGASSDEITRRRMGRARRARQRRCAYLHCDAAQCVRQIQPCHV